MQDIMRKLTVCLLREKHDYQRLFKNPNIRVIGYKKDGKILGYMIFSFKKAHENNFVINDMEINEIVF